MSYKLGDVVVFNKDYKSKNGEIPVALILEDKGVDHYEDAKTIVKYTIVKAEIKEYEYKDHTESYWSYELQQGTEEAGCRLQCTEEWFTYPKEKWIEEVL